MASAPDDLPRSVAWRHVDARTGFEVAFPRLDGDGYRVEGHTSAVEDGEAWAVSYAITLDAAWCTLRAEVTGASSAGRRARCLSTDGAGHWQVDGAPAPLLDGCLDVDLESSSLTNAFPVRRLGMAVGERAEAPAAYVRAPDLDVVRLEQTYVRVDDEDDRSRYDYASPAFDFSCRLVYAADGFVTDYPGIAVRVP